MIVQDTEEDVKKINQNHSQIVQKVPEIFSIYLEQKFKLDHTLENTE
jgi:hypothetical protein